MLNTELTRRKRIQRNVWKSPKHRHNWFFVRDKEGSKLGYKFCHDCPSKKRLRDIDAARKHFQDK